uniref:Uncharacterized protein n=1 Tax=Desulfovibrio sp. U5L TaxID=596152 RepID=I2Q5G2_9BACT
MDGRHCCVCGQKLARMDVYILRAQGKICSRCLLERGIPVGGRVSRQTLHRGDGCRSRPSGDLLPAGG